MEEFAFIHETDSTQILIQKQYLAEENKYEVSFKFHLEGALVTFEIKQKTEESCDKFFESLKNKETALDFISQVFEGTGIEF